MFKRKRARATNGAHLLSSGFTLIEIMFVVSIIGVLAAIAIPNYLKFQARAKTTEATTNLKALYSAQHVYRQEMDSYSASVVQIGFAPERNNRYSYDLMPSASSRHVRDAQLGREQLLGPETGYTADQSKGYRVLVPSPNIALTTPGPRGVFTATAVGSITNDSNPDQWSIASENRGAAATGSYSTRAAIDGTGTCTAVIATAGEPCHDRMPF